MPIEFRFTTGNKAIADSIAVQYGGHVRPVDGQPGQYEVVAVADEELPGDDTAGEVA